MHFEGRKACMTSPGFPWRIQHFSSRCCRVVVPTPRLIKHGVNTELAISYQTKHRKVSRKNADDDSMLCYYIIIVSIQFQKCLSTVLRLNCFYSNSFPWHQKTIPLCPKPDPPVRDALLERFCQLLGTVQAGHARDVKRLHTSAEMK